MDDRISIIVSTYQRKAQLARLLDSFSRLRSRCPLQFIIVDSASTDGTGEMVNDWIRSCGQPDVTFHLLPGRAPLAHARNVGISLSTGTVIAFTDDDCTVDPAWADRLYARLAASPGLAGVGGRVLPVFDDIWSRYYTVFRVLEPPGHINTVIGANCMFRKQPVLDAGMFDEYFTSLGGEEIALCMKLALKGYRFGFEEQAVVYHEYRQGFRNFVRTFYRDGKGDRVIYEHDPDRYLRFMQYPELACDTLAFRHPLLFRLVFPLRMTAGILRQYPSLQSRIPSRHERVLLTGLYACAQVSYHLGRGTFAGRLVKRVQHYRADHPGWVLPVR